MSGLDDAVDPICAFYTRQAERFGPAVVSQHHRQRASRLRRIVGEPPLSVLELGAGGGGTALATAALGYAVTSIELSPLRVQYARELAAQYSGLPLAIQEGDFYTTKLGEEFDVVAYWNGFGVGSDEDQRRLLERVATEWLRPAGRFLVDVFNPFWWSKLAGVPRSHEDVSAMQLTTFDSVRCRFVDRWWPVGQENEAVEQSIRCYSPEDLRLLIGSIGLEIVRLEIDDTDNISCLKDHPDYLAVMRKV